MRWEFNLLPTARLAHLGVRRLGDASNHEAEYAVSTRGESSYLHSTGSVWWDSKLNQFRIDMSTLQFQFTPGTDPSVLDALYGE